MSTLRETLERIAGQHDDRMKNDPRYALTYRYMQEASKTCEPSKHYDRDGYCDNPSRGY